jgi:NhaP-type Na+/H+ or K+/H+ antiporter
VRGIGSIYYLAYAAHHVDLVNEAQLWAAVSFAVLASTVVHVLTAGVAVDRVAGGAQGAETSTPGEMA